MNAEMMKGARRAGIAAIVFAIGGTLSLSYGNMLGADIFGVLLIVSVIIGARTLRQNMQRVVRIKKQFM